MDIFEDLASHMPGPTKELKILNLILIISLAFGLLYDTPEKTAELFNSYNMKITPGIDFPTIIVLLGIMWTCILGADAFYISQKAFYSDYAIGEGMDITESCDGGKLHEVGEWAWLRVGGLKLFSLEGSSAWIGLRSHVHRIGTHIVFEGHMIPDTQLVRVPTEIKPDIRQRRSGLFGINTCSVGYLSRSELTIHKEFKGKDFQNELESEKEKNKIFATQSFIAEISDKDSDVDLMVQLKDDEPTALSNKIRLITEVGEGTVEQKQRGILSHIFG